jgi:phospholipid/cholesterol/gamma-HCH transport system ATP-binding protein
MEAPVRFVDAVLDPILDGASRDFEGGSVSEIVAGGEEACALLVKALAGLHPLAGGKIVLLGQDPSGLSREGLCELRSRMGIFHRGGGLISNLKVVENVALPLLYHSAESAEEIMGRAAAALERAGYRGNLFELPGRLSAFQRAAAGFARVLAADPDVAVYDRLTSDLHEEEKEIFLREASAFHREKAGRVSIFLAARPGSIGGGEPRTVVNLRKGRFE